MRKLFILLLIGIIPRLGAQNLVPNPSFESYNTIPCSWTGSAQEFNESMQDWTQPNGASTDIFSTLSPSNCYSNCFTSEVGHEAPRTGDVMCAILTYGQGCGYQPNYREYLQVKLTQPLIPGKKYYAEYYVSAGDNIDYFSNNFGFYFSTSYVFDPTCLYLNFTPQINDTNIITETNGWVRVSGSFTASDAYTYLLIGNFYPNNQTKTQYLGGRSYNSRYFIDDVLVREASLISLSGNDTICMGDTARCVASGGSSYAWVNADLPDEIISTDSVLIATPINTTKYYLYTPEDTLDFTIEVFRPQSFSLGNDTSLCLGNNLMLQVDFSDEMNYLWSNGSQYPFIDIDTSGVYWLRMTTTAGCSQTDSVQVSFIPCIPPNIGMAANDSAFCEQQCIDFTDLSDFNPTSWQWFFAGAYPSSSNSQNPRGICYYDFGSYDVTLIACNEYGCDTLLMPEFIRVYPKPVDQIVLSGDTLYSMHFESYQWYEVNEGLIEGATDSIYVLTEPGSYYCMITDSIGCTAASNTISVITGLPDLSTKNAARIWYDPASSTLFYTTENIYPERLVIHELSGRKIVDQQVFEPEGGLHLNFKSGIYFIQIYGRNSFVNRKVLIR